MDEGFYYLTTATLYNSRYKGSDSEWPNTRFDQGFAVNALLGKEFILDEGGNILGLNARVNDVGGEHHSPIDPVGSGAEGKVVFEEQNAFEEQFDNRLVTDVRITYRINRSNHASVD